MHRKKYSYTEKKKVEKKISTPSPAFFPFFDDYSLPRKILGSKLSASSTPSYSLTMCNHFSGAFQFFLHVMTDNSVKMTNLSFFGR